MCQNTPQLCWGDEWPSLSPVRQPGRASLRGMSPSGVEPGPATTLILPPAYREAGFF